MAEPDSGRLDGVVHRLRLRIYYEDTDAGGIVYHANYLRYAERARTEYLRLIGAEHARLLEETGAGFAVRHAAIDFRRPARLDDVLEVATVPESMTGARLDLRQTISRVDPEGVVEAAAAAAAVVCDIHLQLVCLDRRGRPTRLPELVRRALAGPLAGPAPGTPIS